MTLKARKSFRLQMMTMKAPHPLKRGKRTPVSAFITAGGEFPRPFFCPSSLIILSSKIALQILSALCIT